jgi:hypothetical protein
MSRTGKLVAVAAGLLAIIITATAFIVDLWAHPTPIPSAPATTTSTTSPVSSATSTTPLLPPPADPPKKHGHGKGRNGGGH